MKIRLPTHKKTLVCRLMSPEYGFLMDDLTYWVLLQSRESVGLFKPVNPEFLGQRHYWRFLIMLFPPSFSSENDIKALVSNLWIIDVWHTHNDLLSR